MSEALKSATAILIAPDALVPIIFAIGFILFGVWTVGVLAVVSTGWFRSRHWFRTTGSVINVIIDDVTKQDDDGNWYIARISYRYRVAGKEYASERHHFVDDGTSYDEAETVFMWYSAGDPIAVWYNPDDPSDAVLDRSVSLKYVVFGIVGIAFSTLGVWTIYLATM